MGFQRGEIYSSGGSIIIQMDACTGFYCIYSSNVLAAGQSYVILYIITHTVKIKVSEKHTFGVSSCCAKLTRGKVCQKGGVKKNVSKEHSFRVSNASA